MWQMANWVCRHQHAEGIEDLLKKTETKSLNSGGQKTLGAAIIKIFTSACKMLSCACIQCYKETSRKITKGKYQVPAFS